MTRLDDGDSLETRELLSLDRACLALIGELELKEPRTLDAHAALLDRVRQLLVAVTVVVNPNADVPRSPEKILSESRAASLYGEFVSWHRAEWQAAARALRLRTVKRAADAVLGPSAEAWLDPGAGPMESRPRNRAVDSEEGLRAVLKELEALYESN